MTSFQIDAIDTLFFRDGKPFSMGEESWANGVFPPYPSTVYGMLRSLHFATHLNELAAANTEIDPTLSLSIQGYLLGLCSGEEEFTAAFPAPNDLYIRGRAKESKARLFRCAVSPSEDKIISDYDYKYLLETEGSGKIQTLGGKALLTRHEFDLYLQGQSDTYCIRWLSDYLSEEPKVGIGRDYHTHRAAEGKLYRVAMKRLSGQSGSLRLLLHFNGLRLRDSGLSRFGAEGKAIEYQVSDFPKIPTPVGEEEEFFKIYFATPALFAEGMYPKSWFQEYGLELLTGALGKAINIGGFDLKEGKPKPMQKAIPAGSVLYVKVKDKEKAKNVIAQLHQGSIYNLAPAQDSYKEKYQRQGFGLTYIGKINFTNNP